MFRKNLFYRICHVTLTLLLTFVFFINNACTSRSPQQPFETRIVEKANSIYHEVVEIRRDLHKHPELSGQESRTAEVIAKRLKSLGLEVKTRVGGHGVVGILRGKPGGPVVAYRADIDALPQDIQENVPFKSVYPGVSHACGHDVHAAVGLGIAQVLASFRDELPGTVKFIFQPAEENIQGAKQMIEAGVMENPTPDLYFAIHVGPFETGKIITHPGEGLPGYDFFSIQLTGGKNLDAATRACIKAVNALRTVDFPKNKDEYYRMVAAVLEKNSFLSKYIVAAAKEDDRNSSSEKKIIKGFFKASDADAYKQAHAQLDKVVSDLKPQYEISAEVTYTERLPDMFCDREVAMEAIKPIEAVLGEQSVLIAYASIPFHSEDFALFIQKKPGVMFFLGASNQAEGIYAAPHNPTFAVDEKAILVGIKGMSNLIAYYLFKLSK
jgi:amidohydrolase